jgi:hypothetical protein
MEAIFEAKAGGRNWDFCEFGENIAGELDYLACAVDVAILVVGLAAEPAWKGVVWVDSPRELRDGFVEPLVEGKRVAKEVYLSGQGMGG